MKKSAILITNTRLMFGMPSTVKLFVIIATFISNLMFWCLWMYLKTFTKLVLSIKNLTLRIITHAGHAWDACLKETGQKLQPLHNYDMLRCFDTVFQRRDRYFSIALKVVFSCPSAIKFSPVIGYGLKFVKM